MRASSFSNRQIIGLLNHYFVPVHVGNQGCPPGERQAKDRIYRDALAAGLKAGTVCAYFVAPDGRPLRTAPLNEKLATDPERLSEVMADIVRELKLPRGEPLCQPKSAPTRPETGPDEVVIHVVARYLQRRGGDLVPLDVSNVLGTKRGGNWGDLPSEDWVILRREESHGLLPPGEAAVGAAWELQRESVGRIVTHFYPPTENTDITKNRIDELELRGRIESITDGVARARLEGRLRMKHPFYHKDDENFVVAKLVGYLEFTTKSPTLRSIRLVTDAARYGGDVNGTQPFGAAARLVAD